MNPPKSDGIVGQYVEDIALLQKCPIMYLLPPRGVTREEVVNDIYNFLLKEGSD